MLSVRGISRRNSSSTLTGNVQYCAVITESGIGHAIETHEAADIVERVVGPQ